MVPNNAHHFPKIVVATTLMLLASYAPSRLLVRNLCLVVVVVVVDLNVREERPCIVDPRWHRGGRFHRAHRPWCMMMTWNNCCH